MISTINGNALSIPLPDKVVQCVITSPPYWGLRDYGVSGQIGLESTPQAYVSNIVAVMRECWRVMREDATLWLVIGDSYAAGKCGRDDSGDNGRFGGPRIEPTQRRAPDGLKPKDLVGIPWRVAFALQDDGWYLRSDIIWHKPNPMPESVTDRPTKAHEYVFLLAKQERYYYDAEAIKEAARESSLSRQKRGVSDCHKNINGAPGQTPHTMNQPRDNDKTRDVIDNRNRRTVWTVATQPYSGAHFATFPPALIEPMILAGTSPQACETCGAPWERIIEYTSMIIDRSSRTHKLGRTRSSGTMLDPATSKTIGWRHTCDCPSEHNAGSGKCLVLDPFAGTSTVGRVCAKHGRKFIGVELNPTYIELAEDRTSRVQIALPA